MELPLSPLGLARHRQLGLARHRQLRLGRPRQLGLEPLRLQDLVLHPLVHLEPLMLLHLVNLLKDLVVLDRLVSVRLRVLDLQVHMVQLPPRLELPLLDLVLEFHSPLHPKLLRLVLEVPQALSEARQEHSLLGHLLLLSEDLLLWDNPNLMLLVDLLVQILRLGLSHRVHPFLVLLGPLLELELQEDFRVLVPLSVLRVLLALEQLLVQLLLRRVLEPLLDLSSLLEVLARHLVGLLVGLVLLLGQLEELLLLEHLVLVHLLSEHLALVPRSLAAQQHQPSDNKLPSDTRPCLVNQQVQLPYNRRCLVHQHYLIWELGASPTRRPKSLTLQVGSSLSRPCLHFLRDLWKSYGLKITFRGLPFLPLVRWELVQHLLLPH